MGLQIQAVGIAINLTNKLRWYTTLSGRFIVRIDRRLILAVAACLTADFAASFIRPFACGNCPPTYGWPAGFSYALQDRPFFSMYCIGASLMYDIVFAVTSGVIAWALWQAILSKQTRKTEQLLRSCTWGWIRIFFGSVLAIRCLILTGQLIWSSKYVPESYGPDGDPQLAGMIVGDIVLFAIAYILLDSGRRMVKAVSKPQTGTEIEPNIAIPQ